MFFLLPKNLIFLKLKEKFKLSDATMGCVVVRETSETATCCIMTSTLYICSSCSQSVKERCMQIPLFGECVDVDGKDDLTLQPHNRVFCCVMHCAKYYDDLSVIIIKIPVVLYTT